MKVKFGRCIECLRCRPVRKVYTIFRNSKGKALYRDKMFYCFTCVPEGVFRVETYPDRIVFDNGDVRFYEKELEKEVKQA